MSCVSKFNQQLDGFAIKVHTPKQANGMHDALRALDDALPATLPALDSFEAPEVSVVTLSNLDLPATSKTEEQEGVDALMLEGYTYPLYRKLRGIGYDFVRGAHGKEGVNRWVCVIKGKESAATLERDVTALLTEEGWNVEAFAGDAAEWDSDEEEDGEEE